MIVHLIGRRGGLGVLGWDGACHCHAAKLRQGGGEVGGEVPLKVQGRNESNLTGAKLQ